MKIKPFTFTLDFLHKSKIVKGFLGKTKSSAGAYILVHKERKQVLTTKSPNSSLVFLLVLCLISCQNKAQLHNLDLTPVASMYDNDQKVEEDQTIKSFTDLKTHLMGFKDNNNKIIIPAQYRVAHEFNKFGIADVVLPTHSGEWYKVNKAGQILVKSYFFDNGPDYYVSGLSRYVQNDKIGFINLKGEIVIPAQFDWASAFFISGPIAVVCKGCAPEKIDLRHKGECYHPEIKGGKWGIIDIEGTLLTSLDFTAYEITKNNSVLLVKGSDKYQLYHDSGGALQLIKLRK